MFQRIVFLLFILFSLNLTSQEISEKNTDSIYFKALELYKIGEYNNSLKYTNHGLDLAPEYHDIRILKVRNLWALKNFKEAGKDIIYLIENAQDYPLVKDLALRQVNYISDTENALNFLEKVEINYGLTDDLQTKRALLLLKMDKRREARETALRLFRKKELSNDLRYSLQNILNRTVSDEIGINYQYIDFSDEYSRSDSWNTLSGEYLHYFNRTAVLGRVTFTDRSYDQGTLYEIETYPVLSDKVYGFLNAGFSNGTLFPDFRGSASLFINFLKILELEAGGRLLHFSDQDYFTGIIGLTAYQGKFFLNIRSFLGPQRLNQLIQNYQFNVRYYLTDTDNYLFSRIGSGISPDERTIFTQVQENPGLDAYYLNLGINKTLGIHHIIQLSAGYLHEDLDQNIKGNQILGNIAYRYRF